MTSWKPELTRSDEPLYVTIATALYRDIESGVLPPGTRLPTHRELARTLQVNVGTITRAYAEAARRGLIDGEVGRGSFVRHPAARGMLTTPAPESVPEGLVDLAFNLPAGGPSQAERAALLRDIALKVETDGLFTGYHLQGLPSHRAAGAHWLGQRGITADPDRIIVAGGAQHALAVALATCAQPGDVILAEALTYTGLKPLTRLLGQRLQPVAIDDDGLVPESFEAACESKEVRALYIQPTSQNPTAVTMPLARREAIVEIARRHDVALVEDDTYGFVDAENIPTLAALAPERTYYFTSLSKSVTSGLRLGYLLPPTDPTDVLERAVASVTAIGWTAAPLITEIGARWIESGVAARCVLEKRAEAKARQDIARRILGPIETPSRRDGCHLWLPLPEPWRANDFVARARTAGAAISSSEAFVVGRGAAPHAVRVCLSTPRTRVELERGLHAIASTLRSVPSDAPALV
ncbi:MAG: PLP-dependent aminotransferase family protein [Planctomycetota bacterium]|nr:PLP-dependent aminotransferase family protein [Planctomycetota bacterium]